MNTATHAHTVEEPTFELARQAIGTLRTLRDKLSPAERETLAILLDKDAMEVITESEQQAKLGQLEPLEKVIASPA